MKYNCFLSIIVPIAQELSAHTLEQVVTGAARVAIAHFSDFEIIVVDNRTEVPVSGLALNEQTRNNTYIVRLAAPVVWDKVVLAGIERANGDFVVTLDPIRSELSSHFVSLYELAQQGNDITYLRTPGAGRRSWRRDTFYRLLSALGSLNIDPRANGCFFMSRRAVNGVVANWKSSSFLGAEVFGAGYVPAAIEVEDTKALLHRTDRQNHDLAWAALTRSAGLPLLIGRMAVVVMAAASAGSALNAILVRLAGVNVFGQPEAYVPGWTFMVVLVSFGFLVTNISIYAVLRFMHVLLGQSEKTPLYTVQRFGRIS